MMEDNIIIEIAAFTPTAAIIAARAGADRIELCAGYAEGGLSPSFGTISLVRKKTSIPLHVMVRPRPGDFIYTEIEKDVILQDIEFCRQAGVNGIVFGALTPEGKPDVPFIKQVMEQSHGLAVTFHRAFDLCIDPKEALNHLIDCGVHRVLTSGAENNAVLGKNMINWLVKQAKGQIIILAGGGLTPDNIFDFVTDTRVREVHFSGKKMTQSPLKYNPNVNLTCEGEVNDTQWYEVDPEKIIKMKKVLEKPG